MPQLVAGSFVRDAAGPRGRSLRFRERMRWAADGGSQGVSTDAARRQREANARANELEEALQEMIAADRTRSESIDAQRETLSARENDLRTVEVRPAAPSSPS